MKNLEKLARTYRLPQTATPEELETRFFTSSATFLTFGDKTLMAGYFWNGPKHPCWYGAVYTFTTADHSCEGEIRLTAVSEDFFPDNGSAIAWALTQTH